MNSINFKTRLVSFFCISLLLLNPTLVSGQDKAVPTTEGEIFFYKMLDYSRPGKYHQILGDLVGTWAWKGRHYSGNPNPDSNKVEIEFNGSAERRSFASGRFFIVEAVSGKGQTLQSPIQNGKFVNENAREITTEGFDNVKNKFIHTLIGNHLGSGMSYSEGDYDSTTKTIVYNRVDELVPGIKMKVIERFIILDHDHYTIEIFGERDGSVIKDTEIMYTRVKRK